MMFFNPVCDMCGARVADMGRHLKFHEEQIDRHISALRTAIDHNEMVKTLTQTLLNYMQHDRKA
ncbi:hypothetical protein ACQP1O_42975 (plasmid) [Nocardia sp. CA-151230]|uniref:hypothetical protein n=1 Tax=Nocardia sp. CA-151230 TaxID=3239982 RepID=UPI003D93E125